MRHKCKNLKLQRKALKVTSQFCSAETNGSRRPVSPTSVWELRMVHLPPGPTSKPGPSGYLTSTRCLCSVGLHQKHASNPLMFPAPPVPLELPQAHFLYFICPCGAPAVSSRAYLPSHIRTARMGLTCQSYPASSSAVILLLGISVCDSKATDLDTSKLRIFLTPLTAHQVPILGMVPLPV